MSTQYRLRVRPSGTVFFPAANECSPRLQAAILTALFPDLEPCAGLDMLGELPIGVEAKNERVILNTKGKRVRLFKSVGPSWSQLFEEGEDL